MNQQTKFKIVTLADFAKLPHGHRRKAAIAAHRAVERSIHKGVEILHIDYDLKYKPRTVFADEKLPKIEVKVTAGAKSPAPTTEITPIDNEIVSLETLHKRIMKNNKDVLAKLCTENGIALCDDDTKAIMTNALISVKYLPEGLELEKPALADGEGKALAPEGTQKTEYLIGSNVQPGIFKLKDGSEVQLGNVVATAHGISGLTVDEWNSADREAEIQKVVDGLDLADEPTKEEPTVDPLA